MAFKWRRKGADKSASSETTVSGQPQKDKKSISDDIAEMLKDLNIDDIDLNSIDISDNYLNDFNFDSIELLPDNDNAKIPDMLHEINSND